MGDNIKLYKNVEFGNNLNTGEYVVIGIPPIGGKESELRTIIGDNALIRSHTVIYAGNVIGDNFQTGHGVMVREENRIGNNVLVGTGSVIEHHVSIADNVRLQSNVFVPEYSVLEEGCWLGPNVVLTNAKYPLSPNIKNELKGVTVRRGAKVGANSTLLPGIVIGENVLVGAGSVVTENIPPDKVVAGNPARIINDMSKLPYRKITGTE